MVELKNKEFYKELYTSQLHNLDLDYLADVNFPQIKPRDKIMLDAPLTKAELEQAVKDLNKNKCPGLDGCPIEVYQVFWPQIVEMFYQLI